MAIMAARTRAQRTFARPYYPKLAPMPAIRRYVREIVARFHADKIILFGSYAYERNPLEAGRMSEPWTYRWSSARFYAGDHAAPLGDEDPGYREISPDPERRQIL
jgi:hypothetical protein